MSKTLPLRRMLELPPTETLPSGVDSYSKAVVLSGMSKSMGMAGIRLGWLVTKDETLYKRLQLLHDYYSICHTAPSEVWHPLLTQIHCFLGYKIQEVYDSSR